MILRPNLNFTAIFLKLGPPPKLQTIRVDRTSNTQGRQHLVACRLDSVFLGLSTLFLSLQDVSKTALKFFQWQPGTLDIIFTGIVLNEENIKVPIKIIFIYCDRDVPLTLYFSRKSVSKKQRDVAGPFKISKIPTKEKKNLGCYTEVQFSDST